MEQLQQKDHGVIFLGVCERAAYIREGQTNLFKWNILGLKQTVLSCIYPLSLTGFAIGFAFSKAKLGNECRVRIADQAGKEVGWVNLQYTAPAEELEQQSKHHDKQRVRISLAGLTIAFATLPTSKLLIGHPGIYSLELLTEDGPVI